MATLLSISRKEPLESSATTRELLIKVAWKMVMTVGKAILAFGDMLQIDLRPVLDSLFSSIVYPILRAIASSTIHAEGITISLGQLDESKIAYLFQYEKAATQLLHRILEAGDIFIDVGAHIGYYSLLGARLVGPTGTVYAFEPDPSNYALLKRNIALNAFTNIQPVEKAVSNKAGCHTLILDRRSGWHSLFLAPRRAGTVQVETTSLDDFFVGSQVTCSVMKIDVQGAEAHVLGGATKLLQNSPRLKIIMEFWPDGLKSAGRLPQDFFVDLQRLGFRVSVIDEERGTLVPVNDYGHLLGLSKGKSSHNILCQRDCNTA